MHDIDYDYMDYLQLPEVNTNQQLSHSSEEISGSLGDAMEKLLTNNDELLWHSLFWVWNLIFPSIQ